MIVNRAYSGKKIVYRAYYNEQLIWDYGKCNRGNAFASLEASMMPYLANQDSAQMLASALMDGFVNAEVSDFENIMVHANMSARTNVAPYSLSPIQIAGTEFITVRATIVPFTFDIVCARGDSTMTLSAYGYHDEIPVVHGSGIAKVKHINSLCPTLEDVVQILGTSKESINDFVIPKSQEPELIVTDLSSNFIVNGSPIVSPIHTVTFMHDGALLYRTKVIEGYDCPNPVTTHVITAPTKEMTVQHTYKFSGWSLTDGGEADIDEVITLLEEQEFGFSLNDAFGAFAFTEYTVQFTLIEGNKYTVIWDGEEYIRDSFAFISFDGSECIAIGNTLVAGGQNNGDKFAIVYDKTHNVVHYMSLETIASHKVALQLEKRGALSRITADTVVYAAFTESIRYYTVRFFDGQTLVDTVSVPYGGTAVTSYTKPGYKTTWYPSNENITGDTDCYGQFDRITFASGTWAEIKAICDAGEAAKCFSVGEKKPITLTYADGTSETINFTIVDMGVDTKEDGTPAALTVMADNQVKTSLQPLSKKSNNIAFTNYDNAVTFFADLLVAFPPDLQDVIVPVKKYYDGGWTPTVCSKIFIPNQKNLNNKITTHNNYAYSNQHILPYVQYKYFAGGASINRTKLGNSAADDYWTATIFNVTSSTSLGIWVDGGVVQGSTNSLHGTTHGIVPCFCI